MGDRGGGGASGRGAPHPAHADPNHHPAYTERLNPRERESHKLERKRLLSDPERRCSPLLPGAGWPGKVAPFLPPWPVRGLRLPGEVPASPGLAGEPRELQARPSSLLLPLLPGILPEPSGLIPAPPYPPSSSRFARFPGSVEKSKLRQPARGSARVKGAPWEGTARPCGGGGGR